MRAEDQAWTLVCPSKPGSASTFTWLASFPTRSCQMMSGGAHNNTVLAVLLPGAGGDALVVPSQQSQPLSEGSSWF